jgi:hypothetical protein
LQKNNGLYLRVAVIATWCVSLQETMVCICLQHGMCVIATWFLSGLQHGMCVLACEKNMCLFATTGYI